MLILTRTLAPGKVRLKIISMLTSDWSTTGEKHEKDHRNDGHGRRQGVWIL
jgi:hypothetical protein